MEWSLIEWPFLGRCWCFSPMLFVLKYFSSPFRWFRLHLETFKAWFMASNGNRFSLYMSAAIKLITPGVSLNCSCNISRTSLSSGSTVVNRRKRAEMSSATVEWGMKLLKSRFENWLLFLFHFRRKKLPQFIVCNPFWISICWIVRAAHATLKFRAQLQPEAF